MKTLTGVLILLAVLALPAKSAPPGRAVTSRTFASNWFVDLQGSVGLVYVERVTDPTTGTTTTNLEYSFCVQTTASSCLEGHGIIPNSDFMGNMKATSKMDVLTLQADTNIPGFDNHLCLGPNEVGGCSQGTSPAAGGIIELTFTKTRSYAGTFTFSDLEKRDGVVVQNTTDTTYQASGNMVGTVIGTSVNNTGAIMSFDTTTSGKTSAQSKGLEKWLAGQQLGPQISHRLQVLTGKNPLNNCIGGGSNR